MTKDLKRVTLKSSMEASCKFYGRLTKKITMSISSNLHFYHFDAIFQRVYLIIVLIESLKNSGIVFTHSREDVKIILFQINV